MTPEERGEALVKDLFGSLDDGKSDTFRHIWHDAIRRTARIIRAAESDKAKAERERCATAPIFPPPGLGEHETTMYLAGADTLRAAIRDLEDSP